MKPVMKHIVLTAIGCVPCRQFEQYLIANKTTTWAWLYSHIRPDMFEALGVKSTPTVVAQVGENEYHVRAIGLQECINYHQTWKLPSSIITGDEEE